MKQIQCGMLGADEKDLAVLSELHRQEEVRIAFVYDTRPMAVGMEIAEILGIDRYSRPEELAGLRDLDYVVVSEPRARYTRELEALEGSGAAILNSGDAIRRFCAKEPDVDTVGREAESYTIEEAVTALEKVLDRGELLKFLLEVSVKATNSSAGSIMLYSPEARELYIAYAIGLSERVIKNTRQKLGSGIAGSVALNKQARLIHQPADRSLYARDRERLDIASAISVPLLWRERLLGVVNVSTGRDDPAHSQRDVERLKGLSRRLSRVLYESLKLQEIQMRHRESKFRTTMGEIAEKEISSGEKLSVLSRYLGDLAGADTVEIFMSTAEGDWLVLGGSSRLVHAENDRLRYQKGALSRAYLEKRCIVLTESAEPSDDSLVPLSSAVYCHMGLRDLGGVVALEFSDRSKLDEFLMIKDAIVGEISRFVGSEMRERRLRRKLDAMGKVSDVAPAVLACRTIDDLANLLTRTIAHVLECRRVSVRLRKSSEDESTRASFTAPPGEAIEMWLKEDEQQYARLAQTGKPFTLAFLDFESEVRRGSADGRSLMALPIEVDGDFFGGVIAYGKHPADPLEDAVFTDLDRELVENINRLIEPVLVGIYSREPAGPVDETEAYEEHLDANLIRFKKLCDAEIQRSNRYHHTFAVVLFRIKPLGELFDTDTEKALTLVAEITQGIRTRTRKTDYGCWVDARTYGMISLEGGNRIRYLVARALTYLAKDVAEFTNSATKPGDILVGVAVYPGTGRTAEELLEEAEKDLKAPAD